MDKPATRICTKCGNEKPLDRDHFTPDKACAHGLKPVCKDCRNAAIAVRRRADPDFAERARAAQRQFYAIPERRARQAERARDWRVRNREHIAAYARAYQRRKSAVDTRSPAV